MKGWKLVKAGETVPDGTKLRLKSGDDVTFLYITVPPSPGKSGKILVDNGHGVREFYPSVIGASILPHDTAG